ncbi:hypothetical protein [Sinorhizobium mexicanum]|uniref:Uncharacterized protein n=1 Tax=Sinorhizobium mexicanum TaxID=375549 RepID=A0A859QSW2_9HYPH|nr:hypothetical protein [Sinorhizobium mexicanum]MBP1881947.1 hypothetical protein [Sinorhizobium mexicanum]QLL61681.1 hypothetical protein FKV68_09595 [Sinorhizobium mexicanum]
MKNRIDTLPDAFARHRHAFNGGGVFILAVTPDGWGFRCYPVESGLEAEELSRADMIAALMELYSPAAFRAL